MGFFFPKKKKKIGWKWKFTLPLLPFQLDWEGFGSWGSSSRPESQVHLFNHGIATVVEFKLGNMDLVRAVGASHPSPAFKIIKNTGNFNYFPISFPRLGAEILEY